MATDFRKSCSFHQSTDEADLGVSGKRKTASVHKEVGLYITSLNFNREFVCNISKHFHVNRNHLSNAFSMISEKMSRRILQLWQEPD